MILLLWKHRVLKGWHKNFLTVSVHSCLYSIEAEQNKKAEEEEKAAEAKKAEEERLAAEQAKEEPKKEMLLGVVPDESDVKANEEKAGFFGKLFKK